MKNSVSILDFDNVYKTQTYFKKAEYELIDLTDIRNTNRYCEKESLISINNKLKSRRNKKITFIGSGNYHYVTYLLMADIKYPFTLVLFDHHTDMLESPSESLITCGSWVLRALDGLLMLKKVVIIGCREDAEKAIPSNFKKKVSIFSKDQLRSKEIKKYIASTITTDNVYISIDKDVLDKSEAVTNWDQGNMKLSQVIKLIEYIAIGKRIYGMDICGEYPYNPIRSFHIETLQAAKINDRTNLEILKVASNL